MQKIFITVGLVAIQGLSLACKDPAPKIKVTTYKAPEVNGPQTQFGNLNIDFPDINPMAEFESCKKSESEIEVSDKAREKPIDIFAVYQMQQTEHVDCGGKVRALGEQPLRLANKIVKVLPPLDLRSDEVNFVKISTPRACQVDSVQAVADNQIRALSNPKDREIVDNNLLGTELGRSGAVALNIVNLELTAGLHISLIDEGANPIQIDYYGKCLKYKAEPQAGAGDNVNCEEAELLGSREILVNLSITRVSIEGVNRVDVCTEME